MAKNLIGPSLKSDIGYRLYDIGARIERGIRGLKIERGDQGCN